METIKINFTLDNLNNGRVIPSANQKFVNTPTGKEGINRYNLFVGFVLAIFGFAYKVEDTDHKTFYLNKKSLIGWLQANGQSDTTQKVQDRFNAVIGTAHPKPSTSSKKVYEPLWLTIEGNTRENMPKNLEKECEQICKEKVEDLRIRQQKKERAINRSENLKAEMGGYSDQFLNNQLKELVRASYVGELSPLMSSLFIEHPSIEELLLFISYNKKLDKFVLALTGSVKPNFTLAILEYTLTNKANSHTFQMKQAIAKKSEGLRLNSLGALSHPKDKPQEPQCWFPEYAPEQPSDDLEIRSQDNDSAWLLDYDTVYTVTFPDSYNIKPMNFQIKT